MVDTRGVVALTSIAFPSIPARCISMRTTETYLWHIWPARHWPCSTAEEQAVVEDLTRRTNLSPEEIHPFERGDLTTVLNTLRNGMTIDELIAVAPGVVPSRLLSAYRHIDRLRLDSVRAFTALIDNLCDHTVNEDAPRAALLLPVPTYRLVASWMGEDATTRTDTRRNVLEQVKYAATATDERETTLASNSLEDIDAVRLGRVLYDPFAGGLWSHPYYVPTRVGTLVPARVRDLLGEKEE